MSLFSAPFRPLERAESVTFPQKAPVGREVWTSVNGPVDRPVDPSPARLSKRAWRPTPGGITLGLEAQSSTGPLPQGVVTDTNVLYCLVPGPALVVHHATGRTPGPTLAPLAVHPEAKGAKGLSRGLEASLALRQA